MGIRAIVNTGEQEEPEAALLLQSALVHINTLLLQAVSKDPQFHDVARTTGYAGADHIDPVDGVVLGSVGEQR